MAIFVVEPSSWADDGVEGFQDGSSTVKNVVMLPRLVVALTKILLVPP